MASDSTALVSGHVRWQTGEPAGGVLLRAVDRDLRADEPLGEARTSADGAYEIAYGPESFARGEIRSADLVVSVVDANGDVVVSSPTLFNAPPAVTVDLVISGAVAGLPSEVERIVARLGPLFEGIDAPKPPRGRSQKTAPRWQSRRLLGLRQSDIDFLVPETGLDRDRLTQVVAAAGLCRDAEQLDADIPVAAFYGLSREGVATSWPALATTSPESFSGALIAAIKGGVIPADLEQWVKRIVADLHRVAVQRALAAPAADGVPALGAIFDAAGVPGSAQAKLLSRAAASDGTSREFWAQLASEPEFDSPGTIQRVQLAAQLGQLTGNHLPLIRALVQQRQVTSLEALVEFSRDDWKTLLGTKVDGQPAGVPPGVPGTTLAGQRASYVESLVTTIRAAFPTLAVAHLINQNAPLIADDVTRQRVVRFLREAPGFNLASTRISTYLAEHQADAAAGDAAAPNEAVAHELKRLQRAFQLSTNAETMATLLDSHLDAAHIIAGIPRRSFLDQYGAALGGTDVAEDIYRRAQYFNARSLLIYATLNDAKNGVTAFAIGSDANGSGPQRTQSDLIKRFPDYAELFGSLGLCECKECRSALSPAAYFVDLLHFLSNSTPNAAGKTPRDVLFARRADLQFIELTCENTYTFIPYIDLVNEVLESYIAYGHLDQRAAYDTGDTPQSELDANPQHTNSDAYKTLSGAVFPFTLPFNQPVTAARIYLEHLGTSRYEIIKTFQPTASAAADRAAGAEYLTLSREQYQRLCGSDFDGTAVAAPPVNEQYGYPATTIPQGMRWEDDVASVPEFLRRTGIAYTDLAELLKTRFVNPGYPQGADEVVFTRLPVDYPTLAGIVASGFGDASAVTPLLTATATTLPELKAWSSRHIPGIGALLVLQNPEGSCDLDTTRLVHLDESPITDKELARLRRFIALWRSVRWSIPDLDRALNALSAADVTADVITALARISQLQQTLHINDPQILISFWADLPTWGDASLYGRLFLSRATLPADDTFAPGADGSVLTSPAETITGHLPAILAALQISSSDLDLIRADAGLTDIPQPAPLTLANVSLLWRYAALARALSLSVPALTGLKTLAGDSAAPFTSPDTTAAFTKLANQVSASGFTPLLLNYLYRHLSEPPTSPAPQLTTVRLLAKSLRDGLLGIAAGNAPAPDPAGTLTRTALTQLISASVADQTIAMISGTVVYAAPLSELPFDLNTLPAMVTAKVSYDKATAVLRFTGAMTSAERGALLGASADAGYQAAVGSLYQQPADFIANALGGLLDPNAALSALVRDEPSLDQDLNPVLLNAAGGQVTDPAQAVTTAVAAKFGYLLAAVLPSLRRQLSHTLIKQTIADTLGVGPAAASLLLESVLRSPTDRAQPVVIDLLALATPGFTAQYYPTPDLTGAAATMVTVPAVDFDGLPGPATGIPPGTASARWTALLAVPATAAYTFSVAGAGTAALWVGDDPQPVPLAKAPPTAAMVSEPISLSAGQLVPLRLELTGIAASPAPATTSAQLAWQTASIAKGAIPPSVTMPGQLFDNAARAYLRVQKAALVVKNLPLSPAELAYFSAHSGDFAGFDLNALPLDRNAGTQAAVDAAAAGLFAAWRRLQAYASLRQSLPSGSVTLLDVFAAPTVEAAMPLLAQATGWDAATVAGLIGPGGFNLTAANPLALKNEIWPATLQRCVTLAHRTGASPSQLFEWAKYRLDFAGLRLAAQDIKQVTRSRYSDATWQTAAKPLSDRLRAAQRDALTAYLLASLNLDSPNQLFEYFLIDAEMDPCMETTRIRQAINSVQLFVQRCRINLEDGVSPSAIDSAQWQWKSQYALWVPAYQTFWYPENWLFPALRDDKSALFNDLESALLQNELTSDNAEAAFLAYLRGLDQVARLDIRAVYLQDADPQTGEPVNILHVFARTFHNPRQYFYRRLIDGTTWTSWEPVHLDIQGDHLAAVVWERKLRLIWPIFTEQTAPQDSSATATVSGSTAIAPDPPEKYWKITLAWSEYTQGKWAPKNTSDDFLIHMFRQAGGTRPEILHAFYMEFPADTYTIKARVEASPTQEDLVVDLYQAKALFGEFRFSSCGDTLRVAYSPSPLSDEPPLTSPHQSLDHAQFAIMYEPSGTAVQGNGFGQVAWRANAQLALAGGDALGDDPGGFGDPNLHLPETTYLGRTPTQFELRHSQQFWQFALQAPFFYQDDTRTFFVSTRPGYDIIEQLSSPESVDVQNFVRSSLSTPFAALSAVPAVDAVPQAGVIAQPVAAGVATKPGSALAGADLRQPGVLVSPDSAAVTGRPGITSVNWSPALGLAAAAAGSPRLQFYTHRHPYVCDLIKALYRQQGPAQRGGIDALLGAADQELGNPSLAAPWNRVRWGTVDSVDPDATGPASFIQGDFYETGALAGNFEAVVVENKQLVHYHKDNADLTIAWIRGPVITHTASGPGCVIQSDFLAGGHGNLEVVVQQGSDLVHYWREGPDTWNPEPGQRITGGVTGAACLVQTDYTVNGHGRLDVLVLKGTRLIHYFTDAAGGWTEGETITTRAAGPGAMIQSDFMTAGHGNLEAVVPELPAAGPTSPPWDLAHYWFDGTNWQRGGVVTTGAVGPASLIQGDIADGPHANFEAVVPEQAGLVHYWRDNSAGTGSWRPAQIITPSTQPGCIIQGGFRPAGADNANFEVLAFGDDGKLAHYWHPNDAHYQWLNHYAPTAAVDAPYPAEDLDFSYGGAYSVYNWELFFHAPLMIAAQLSQNQRFEEADRWFRYIFDPTNDAPGQLTPSRYWSFLPFKTAPQQNVTDLMLALDAGDPEFIRQVKDWQQHPFEPYRIARLRITAFQKSMFMKYLDNLIAWGDQLFAHNSIESINQATQLYILAADLLGDRPERIPPRAEAPPLRYADIAGKLDALSNLFELLENEFPYAGPVPAGPPNGTAGLLGLSKTLLFCIPQNDKMLQYWDTIDERLAKIRHCENIQGTVQQLPPFEPPLDPALLVEAAARGVDLGSVLNDLSAPQPNYRFSYLIAQARELVADCKSFGTALLAALEKKDAEELAALRATQETNILNLMRDIKQKHVDEAQAAIDCLTKSRDVAVGRYGYYQQLLGNAVSTPAVGDTIAPVAIPAGNVQGSGATRLISEEQSELDSSHSARDWQVRSSVMETLASLAHYIPSLGVAAEPFGVGTSLTWGGDNVGPALAAIARYQQSLGAQDSYDASHAGKMASYVRRQQEWSLQSNQAAGEIMRIDKDLAAANLRLQIAKGERDVHDQQVTDAQAIQDYLTGKYTNQDLYSWMISQTSGIYFQIYQMAYDAAKLAERAFRQELAVSDSNYIQFGYWDSLRKGLLAGEQLQLGLKQLERAYIDKNVREYEITRNVSLLLHAPVALIALKETGQCVVELPEALYDMDYPGHYLRRLKSVSLTIPCIAGPYTGINCTLTLLASRIRVNPDAETAYPESADNDPRFSYNFSSTQSIATSQGQNDSGVFELSFRDERYLPFETAGAISRWLISMPPACNAFDFDTISDVIMRVSYTAREGGDLLRKRAFAAAALPAPARQSAPDQIGPPPGQTSLARLFSARHEFPDEWYGFLHPVNTAAAYHQMPLLLATDRFPFQFRGQALTVGDIEVVLNLAPTTNLAELDLFLTSTAAPPLGGPLAPPAPDTANDKVSLTPDPLLNGALHATKQAQAGTPKVPFCLWISVKTADATPLTDLINDIFIVIHYSASAS